MPEKDPNTYWTLTYLWVLLLAGVGGLVRFIRELNQATTPKPLKFIFLKLVGELIVSSFAGVVTFLLCQAMDIDLLWSAVATAVAGHMGGNAIDTITKIIKYKAKKLSKLTETEGDKNE